jgi:hypothetical protein
MDYNAAIVGVTVAYLYESAIAKLDSSIGFPCFIYYNRVFQLLTKVWNGCYYLAASRALGFSQLECEFLFRWFLLGGVLDDDELQLTLSFTLKYCARVPLPQTAWGTLKEFFMFACQQGRLEQPWRVSCVRWIQSHRL